MLTQWEYSGDADLSYGGYFYRHDLNSNGFPYYTEVVRITDLASATGADGLTLVEFLTTFDQGNKDRVKKSLDCIGFNIADLRKMGKKAIIDLITEAYLDYGYYDPWEEYFNRPAHFVIVNDDFDEFSSKATWDGWEISKEETVALHKKYNGNLEDYINGEWLQ